MIALHRFNIFQACLNGVVFTWDAAIICSTLRYLFLISSQNEFHLDTDRVGNDGQVFSRPLDLGLSDGQDEVALEDLVVDLEGHAVHQLVLQDHDRIGISDGSLVKGQSKAIRYHDHIAMKIVISDQLNISTKKFQECPSLEPNMRCLGFDQLQMTSLLPDVSQQRFTPCKKSFSVA